MSAAIFSTTKGRGCVVWFDKQPHESFLLFACAYNNFRVWECFLWAALIRLCLTVSDMCHVLCWHWDWEKGYGTDWFKQGHCEAPGINVDSFGPGIMYLPRLQSTHCTYCVSFFTKYRSFRSNKKSIQSCLIQWLACYTLIPFQYQLYNRMDDTWTSDMITALKEKLRNIINFLQFNLSTYSLCLYQILWQTIKVVKKFPSKPQMSTW